VNPTYDFEGQVALVTGASSGMGLVTARAFAEQGATVALADINEDALRGRKRRSHLRGPSGARRRLRRAATIGGTASPTAPASASSFYVVDY
jgi:NAD(P)-dependent dehydrogenase (short-subunit alcohol dehydrogenase family)